MTHNNDNISVPLQSNAVADPTQLYYDNSSINQNVDSSMKTPILDLGADTSSSNNLLSLSIGSTAPNPLPTSAAQQQQEQNATLPPDDQIKRLSMSMSMISSSQTFPNTIHLTTF